MPRSNVTLWPALSVHPQPPTNQNKNTVTVTCTHFSFNLSTFIQQPLFCMSPEFNQFRPGQWLDRAVLCRHSKAVTSTLFVIVLIIIIKISI